MTLRVISLLKAFRLFDGDNTASLTSIMMMVLIYRVATAPALDWATVSTLFLALASYNARKWFAKAKASKEIAEVEKLKELEEMVKRLNQAAQAKKLGG